MSADLGMPGDVLTNRSTPLAVAEVRGGTDPELQMLASEIKAMDKDHHAYMQQILRLPKGRYGREQKKEIRTLADALDSKIVERRKAYRALLEKKNAPMDQVLEILRNEVWWNRH